MTEPLITYERALASLAEAVAAYASNQKPSTFDAMEDALAVFVDACETYMSDQRPQTFDEMERACLDAKKLLKISVK